MDKSVLLQKQVKDNSEDLQSEFLDMKNWEEQMRRKDEELRKEATGQISIPPIRSKTKKKVLKTAAKESGNTGESKRIKSYDYSSWDKFDVDKACKEVDKEEESNESEDEVMSKKELEKAHDIATKHKQEGNAFVQQQKWAKAIACYNNAIKVFPYDATFFANRALCQLKLDNLYSAEADSSAAVQLDETYTKAYHRRAIARIGLKQYKEAKPDLEKVLKLEPSNKEASMLLAQVEKKIEASRLFVISKDDISDERTIEQKIGEKMCSNPRPSVQRKDNKIDDKSLDHSNRKPKQKDRDPRIPDWLPEKDDVAVVEPIDKPAHLRSKKPLTRIPVEEVDFATIRFNERDKKTIEDNKQIAELPKTVEENIHKKSNGFVKDEPSKDVFTVPPVPKTAVQFLFNWKTNKSPEFRYQYLKQLPASSMSKIFLDSMESDIFSGILEILRTEFTVRKDPVFRYLEDLSEVKRFRALIMFMTNSDKEGLKLLFEHCKKVENISEEEIRALRDKYEV